jgi:hypothetical protein
MEIGCTTVKPAEAVVLIFCQDRVTAGASVGNSNG